MEYYSTDFHALQRILLGMQTNDKWLKLRRKGATLRKEFDSKLDVYLAYS